MLVQAEFTYKIKGIPYYIRSYKRIEVGQIITFAQNSGLPKFGRVTYAEGNLLDYKPVEMSHILPVRVTRCD